MSQTARALRIGEWLIHTDCRRLPADVRAERRREWIAELPAILDDQSLRPPFLRTLRVLTFCIGISRATRQLSRSARAGARRTRSSQWRAGGLPARPGDLAARVARGLVIWLVLVAGLITLITLLTTGPHPDTWPLLIVVALGIGFDAYCLADIARAAEVRYLRKWAWAIICLIQCPGGGIMYLSIGRIGRPHPAPPGDAKP
jgi:hypothetical protein